MTTTREQILAAIYDLLPATGTVIKSRNLVDADEAGQDAIVTLYDGECNVAETILSPVQYYMEMRPSITVLVQSSKEAYRRSLLDGLLASIQTALLADRTLGGLCDWMELQPPDLSDDAVNGPDQISAGAPAKYARIVPIINYVTTSSIG